MDLEHDFLVWRMHQNNGMLTNHQKNNKRDYLCFHKPLSNIFEKYISFNVTLQVAQAKLHTKKQFKARLIC